MHLQGSLEPLESHDYMIAYQGGIRGFRCSAWLVQIVVEEAVI